MSLGRSLGASLGGSLAGSLAGAGAGAPPVNPYVPPIGVTPLVLWDARGGVAQSGGMVDGWTDQMRGLVFTPPSGGARPAYGADGTYFLGRNVIKFDGVDDQLRVIGVSPAILPVGARPHWFYVFRTQVPTANQRSLWILLDDPATAATPMAYTAASSDALVHQFFPGQIVTDPLPLGTGPHLQEFWLTPSGTFAARDGAAPVSTAQGDPTTVETETIYVGSDHTGNFTAMSLAAIGCYSTALTTQQRADLLAYYRNAWGALQRPPLPANTVEYWHSELECTPTSWKGQILGSTIVSQSATPPTVAPDPGYFNGRVVGQTVAATQSRWRNNAAFSPAIMAAGTPLYAFGVYRIQATANSVGFSFQPSTAGGTTAYIGANATRSIALLENRALIQGQTEGSNAVHFSEFWIDGTNQNLQGEQNTLFTQGSGGVTTQPIAWITVGATPQGTVTYNASHAFYLLCNAVPTVAERDALKAWARSYWGIA
jgi:hypothetical protein